MPATRQCEAKAATSPFRKPRIRTFSMALAALALSGCAVVPAYPEYSYGPRYAHPGYYDHRGYYYHRYYFHDAP
jgi:hypothetical protein